MWVSSRGIDNVLVSNKIEKKTRWKKKTSSYVKSYYGQTKWIYFLIEDVNWIEKNIILFGIKSGLILKKNFIANLFIAYKFLTIKTKSYGDEAIDFHDKQMPKVIKIYPAL